MKSFFARRQGQWNFKSKMTSTNFSRKLDTTGRIMIPIRLREQMGMVPGRVYYFSTIEENGRKYICIDCGIANFSGKDVEEAVKIVEANGMKVSRE